LGETQNYSLKNVVVILLLMKEYRVLLKTKYNKVKQSTIKCLTGEKKFIIIWA
jgi:hypothetical protein